MTRNRVVQGSKPVFAAIILAVLIAGCPFTIDIPAGSTLDFIAVPAEFSLPADDCAAIPLQLVNGLAIAEVTINGAGPFAAVIDTGSATTLVSPDVAALFPEAVYETESVISAAENSDVQVTEVLAISSLTLGPTEASGFHANVVDLTDTEAAFRTTIDAIVGFSAFANVTLTIDYPLAQMRIEDTQVSATDGENVMALTVTGARPFIDVRVGSTTLKTSVDTGFSGILSVPASAELSFTSGPLPWFTSTDLTGTRIERQIGRLADDIWLGSDHWETPVVVIDDKSAANLGSGVLQLYALTFDQRSCLLRMSRSSSGSLQSNSQYTRGFDATEIGGQVVIDEILAGGPAEYAGMQVGDIIIEVNDNTIAGLDTLVLPPRDQVAFIDVLRGDEVVDLAVPMWTWVE